ncbi:MAG: carboxypeptidase-like regulatory domain-containing protein [Bacteroidales bacterium]|nr:carboxypeptidase-like regulatory domain-containing protein [Bacteroidales bacterium]
MGKTYKFWILILIIFIGTNNSIYGQLTKVRGVIIDFNTQEPVPFANVTFKNSSIGTITNTDGEYFLETRKDYDSIIVSFIGYKQKVSLVQKYHFQELNFELEPDVFALEEIVVRPTENPAHPILRNIIANKAKHNPDKFESYNYKLYNKVEIDINNVDEDFKNQRLLRDFQFIFDYVDTSAITGKSYLPIFITESFSDYYFNKNPKLEREIINATKISGVENTSISQFTGKMYQKINIYNNYESVFEPGFVSPIADFGLMYYKYYLIDSAFIGDKYCYQISFIPKRKQERTFRGDFWVNDSTFAIVKIQMRMAKDVNINYINDFVANYEYELVNDSLWFLKNEQLFFDFNLTDKTLGFFGRKSTNYMNIELDAPVPEEVSKINDNVIVKEDAIINDEEYWDAKRPEKLTPKEKDIYKMVEEIQDVPIYRTYEKIVGMFAMYHFEVGLFEIGPYYKMFSFNEIEGNRFRFGGRTSNNFSTKLMFNAHAAYGEKDERFKYGGGFIYMFNKNPRLAIGAQYKNDIQQLGQSPNALTEDNFFTSLLRRNPNYKLTMVNDFSTYVEKEWFQGLSNKLTFNYKSIEPTEYIPFQKTSTNDTVFFEDVTTTEVSLNIRFAKNEKFIRGEFERVSLGTNKPIFNINLTAGLNNIFGSQYEYYKVDVSLAHKVPMGTLGYFKYILDVGQVFGDVPYPLLKLHEGNETYGFDRYAFNMMNYYEFASDRYISLYAEHHFQGLFLNKIPLMRKLKWREVISAKGLIGELSNRHESIMDFPEGLYQVNDPYLEASVGIENILKIFRVDAMWRLSYLDHEDIEKFGVRVLVQFVF